MVHLFLMLVLVLAVVAASLVVPRLQLIPAWQKAHRYWSVRIATAGSVLMTAMAASPAWWAGLPPEVRGLVPVGAQAVIPLLLFTATVLARMVSQPKAAPAAPTEVQAHD